MWCPQLESLTLSGTPLLEGAVLWHVGFTPLSLLGCSSVDLLERYLGIHRFTGGPSLAADSHRPFAQTPDT